MFLALRDLRFGRGRFALVGLVIGLVALMATVVTGLAEGLVDDGISGLRRLPLTHVAFQPGAKSTFSRSTLTEANLAPWQNVEGVEASALGVSFLNARRADGSTIDLALFGVPPDSFLVPPGEAQQSLAGKPGIILSEKFRSEGLAVGDELTIVGIDRRLPVLGFTYSGSYGHVDLAFASLQTWQELLYGDNAKGRFSAIAITTEGSSGANTDLKELARRSDTDVETKQDAYQGSPGYSGETQTMSLIRGFLLLISALIVGSFFTVWTVQRTRQIGLLKALGASSAYVLRDALGQIGLVLVAATFVGAGVAVGLGQLIGGGVPFHLEVQPVLTSIAALIVLGMVGSLVAVRRITSVEPVVALSSEH